MPCTFPASGPNFPSAEARQELVLSPWDELEQHLNMLTNFLCQACAFLSDDVMKKITNDHRSGSGMDPENQDCLLGWYVLHLKQDKERKNK